MSPKIIGFFLFLDVSVLFKCKHAFVYQKKIFLVLASKNPEI